MKCNCDSQASGVCYCSSKKPSKEDLIKEINNRTYQWFLEGHEPVQRNPDKCAAYVNYGTMWFFRQCKRKHGHGLGGLFCKFHAKNTDEENK